MANPAYQSEPAVAPEPRRDVPVPGPHRGIADPSNDNPGPAVPGTELPSVVYLSVAASFAWMMAAALIAFGHGREAEFNIAVAVVLMLVFLTLPFLIYRTAMRHTPRPSDEGRSSPARIETATGELTTTAAWAQIALIPAALALAATLIGAAYLLLV